MAKRILITILDGLHYRYLVDTGIVNIITREPVEILILTSAALQKKLEQTEAYQSAKITIRLLNDVNLTRMQRLYMFLINNTDQKLSETLNVKNDLRKKTSRLSYMLRIFVRSIHKTFLYKILLKLTARSFGSAYYEKILWDFKPSLVVLSTPGQKINDLPVLYESIKQKLPTLSPVYSWDNLTAKGPFIFPVDRLIVWNEIMREEAMVYHDYTKDRVDVAGVPVFDNYVNVLNEAPTHRAEFRKQFGFDTTIPLITITTIPTLYFGKSHGELAKRILAFRDSGNLPACNVLIRPHPLDDTDYRPLQELKGIAVDYYGSAPEKNSIATWTPREDNITHLARTMKYSDIVINIASTITIDAACFDTPVINIAYDMKASESEYSGKVERYYSYTHYKHVVDSGAAMLVRSDSELLSAIQTYMENPAHLTKERHQLVEQQTGKLDGLAHARVAAFIIKTFNQQ